MLWQFVHSPPSGPLLRVETGTPLSSASRSAGVVRHADQLSIHCQATLLAAIDMSWVFFIPEEIKARAMATAEASRAASEYAIR